MQKLFSKSLIVSGLALGAAVFGQSASASSEDLVRWQSVIGIIQGNNIVGTGAGAVMGAPGPWSTLGGHASANLQNGKVDFNVRGLVLAAGNSIGTPGTITQVRGTLVCDTDGSASGTSITVDTPLVDLDEEGDAHFDGFVPAVPAVCLSEPDIAFLIRTGSGRWLANGTVLR
jgi:hypothetical protein